MTKKILLLGSGELGKEFVIAAKRLGQYVVACDSYAGAPAMQVADACEVFDMLDGDRLEAVVAKYDPDTVSYTHLMIYKFLRFFIHTLSDSVQWGIFTPNVALILLLSSTE